MAWALGALLFAAGVGMLVRHHRLEKRRRHDGRRPDGDTGMFI